MSMTTVAVPLFVRNAQHGTPFDLESAIFGKGVTILRCDFADAEYRMQQDSSVALEVSLGRTLQNPSVWSGRFHIVAASQTPRSEPAVRSVSQGMVTLVTPQSTLRSILSCKEYVPCKHRIHALSVRIHVVCRQAGTGARNRRVRFRPRRR